MVDKYEAKQYVTEKIGEGHVVPLLGGWDDSNDIDFDALPNQFVLKCNHNSGLGMVVCTDKTKLDTLTVRKKLKQGLKQKYYFCDREWPYKNVKPKIIAETFLKDSENECLVDYKFFCFNGEPKFMYRSMDYSQDPHTDFYDMDYNRLEMRMRDPNSDKEYPKPKCFEEMKKYAEILSKDIPHLRVDFYEVDGVVYVGEMTFFHCGGFASIYPEKWMDVLGDWIQLPSNE